MPDKLQKVTVPVVSDATCRAKYRLNNIADSMICAGDLDVGKTQLASILAEIQILE